ncbi:MULTISPECIES: MFS transporter [unclassified Roseitalea]|uniref:MFS transporter n=1 Tax=unclassified Roseitalea TaxID=2639107 RepID=UPI00273D29F3|nr:MULTISPECIES: MFS transporter [unclassified Roseitalea]
MIAPQEFSEPPRCAQLSDYQKLRRLPFLYGFTVLTGAAVLCTVQAPLALFAAELGLGEDQIGLLAGMAPLFQVVGIAALPIMTRFGSRRLAGSALIARYIFLLALLVAPTFADRPGLVFAILLFGMAGFSVMRAVAEAAIVPWSQEFLPRAVRGRVNGMMAVAFVPVALIVSWLIQLWLDGNSGIERFYVVFTVGIVVGVIGAAMLFGLAGGAARERSQAGLASWRRLAEPLSDRNFLTFLYSSGTQYLVFVALNVFMLLFFRERLAMSSGQLVLMAAFMPVGAAIGALGAGWFVDRYGTRAMRLALQTGQIALLLSLPFVTPALPGLDMIVALAFLLFGLLFQGSIAVSNVYLLNNVPASAKESYMALHYSIDGLIGGGITFAAGWLLTWLATNPVTLSGHALGNYETLFAIGAAVIASSAVAFFALREDDAISVRDFVGHISSGGTLRALWAIQVYSTETSEDRRRSLAYGFGSIGNPLAKGELLDALRDPSFDVRHEAILSLGHMSADPQIVAALEAMLDYQGLTELQYAALTSLGRLRAISAASRVAALLDDPNPLLRARAIRTLGEMRSIAHIDAIRDRLTNDIERDCRLAAVSALGKLGDRDSFDALIETYRQQIDDGDNPMAEPRSKVVLLALAKVISCEESFSQVWRREQASPGTAIPVVLERIAAGLRRRGLRDQARRMRMLAASFEPDALAHTRDELCALRSVIARRRHGDVPLVLKLIDGTAALPSPHPALVVLLAVAIRRVVRW